MTQQTLSSAARDGAGREPAARTANNGAPDAVHAYVENGVIHLLDEGRIKPVSRWEAVAVLGEIDRSDCPATIERARQIRAALIATQREVYAFRAPRFGDLVVCPYCGADTFTCDHCGGERRLYASEVFSGQCDSPLPPLTGGLGGKLRSPVESPQSMKTSRTKGTSKPAASPTESGSEARSYLPASGGSRARSTPRPATFSPPKSAAPKSTDGALIHGEHGRG